MARLTTATIAAGRIAARAASNSRLVRAGISGGATVLRSFLRVAHILWLQITGVLFCFFAVGFASRLPRAYSDHIARKPGHHFELLIALTLMFAWFGVSSFWRASRR
jgi:hypothetical protein